MLERIIEQAFAGLLHLATEGLGRRVSVLPGVMVKDTSPQGLVARFDDG